MMTNDEPRFLRPLAAAFAALLVLAAAAGAQGRDPDAPDDLLEPPPDAERSPSGLVSKVLRAGSGDARPDGNDLVGVHFTGWTPFGAKFQTTEGQERPAIFDLSETFAGWREGIQLMVEGEKRRLWIPAHLAPESPTSGPKGAVVFDVELVEFRAIPNLPPGLGEPPEDAEQTASGSFTRLVSAGEGDVKPGPDDVALVHWTGWTKDGNTFGSSLLRGRPTAFPMDKVMAPFADAVQLMALGEKRHIWIPANLADGQWPGAPSGMLIFEVELLRILPRDLFQAGVEAATQDPGPR